MSNQNQLNQNVLSHHHARGTLVLEVFVIQLHWCCCLNMEKIKFASLSVTQLKIKVSLLIRPSC